MEAENNKIIVSVNFSQKQSTNIDGVDFLTAKEFSTNKRESMPVICMVEEGNKKVSCGTFLLVHHNRFVEHSPHHLGENIYSLAYNSSIFARVDENGNAHQMCGNIIVERIYDNNDTLTPEHLKEANKNKYRIAQNGYGYKKGQYIFCFNYADYEIIYTFNGVEKRVVKVIKEDIVGKLKYGYLKNV